MWELIVFEIFTFNFEVMYVFNIEHFHQTKVKGDYICTIKVGFVPNEFSV